MQHRRVSWKPDQCSPQPGHDAPRPCQPGRRGELRRRPGLRRVQRRAQRRARPEADRSEPRRLEGKRLRHRLRSGLRSRGAAARRDHRLDVGWREPRASARAEPDDRPVLHRGSVETRQRSPRHPRPHRNPGVGSDPGHSDRELGERSHCFPHRHCGGPAGRVPAGSGRRRRHSRGADHPRRSPGQRALHLLFGGPRIPRPPHGYEYLSRDR